MEPGTAFFLLMAGILGIYLELYKQGWVLPGVAGCVLVMLGLSGFAGLPLQPAGIILILLGLSLMTLAAWTLYRVSLGIVAAITLMVGIRFYSVPTLYALAGIIPFTFLTIVLFASALRARKNKAIRELSGPLNSQP